MKANRMTEEDEEEEVKRREHELLDKAVERQIFDSIGSTDPKVLLRVNRILGHIIKTMEAELAAEDRKERNSS